MRQCIEATTGHMREGDVVVEVVAVGVVADATVVLLEVGTGAEEFTFSALV